MPIRPRFVGLVDVLSTPSHCSRRAGFTLIELMVAVAVLAILTAIALPSYNRYIVRSKAPVGLDALTSYAARMEQRFQDVGNYGTGGACGVTVQQTAANYTLSCTYGTPTATGFTATAVGSGPLAGMSFSIDDQGVRKTLANPNGPPPTDCWSIRGGTCDS